MTGRTLGQINYEAFYASYRGHPAETPQWEDDEDQHRWQAAAEAVRAAIAVWPVCGECNGKGSGIFRKPELHATDRLLYQMVCPVCGGLGRVKENG